MAGGRASAGTRQTGKSAADQRASRKAQRTTATQRAKAGTSQRAKASTSQRAKAGTSQRTATQRASAQRSNKQGVPRSASARTAVGSRSGSPQRPTKQRATQHRSTTRGQRSSQQRPAKRGSSHQRHSWKKILFVIGVLLIAVGAVVVTRYSLGKIDEHTTAVDPALELTPVACTSTMLSSTLTVQGDQAGAATNLVLNLTNSDPKVPCFIEPGDSSLRVTVTSGEEQMFDSVVCDVPVVPKRLLLSPGLTTNPSVTWSGVNGGTSCTGTALAEAGTYVARAYLNGQEMAGSGVVFELY